MHLDKRDGLFNLIIILLWSWAAGPDAICSWVYGVRSLRSVRGGGGKRTGVGLLWYFVVMQEAWGAEISFVTIIQRRVGGNKHLFCKCPFTQSTWCYLSFLIHVKKQRHLPVELNNEISIYYRENKLEVMAIIIDSFNAVEMGLNAPVM